VFCEGVLRKSSELDVCFNLFERFFWDEDTGSIHLTNFRHNVSLQKPTCTKIPTTRPFPRHLYRFGQLASQYKLSFSFCRNSIAECRPSLQSILQIHRLHFATMKSAKSPLFVSSPSHLLCSVFSLSSVLLLLCSLPVLFSLVVLSLLCSARLFVSPLSVLFSFFLCPTFPLLSFSLSLCVCSVPFSLCFVLSLAALSVLCSLLSLSCSVLFSLSLLFLTSVSVQYSKPGRNSPS